MGKIVVGIDGSPASRAALEFAVEEARLRGAELDVVYVYESRSTGQGLGDHAVDWETVGLVRSGDTPPSSDDESMRRASMRRREEDYRRHQSEADAEAGRARTIIDDMLDDVETDSIQVTAQPVSAPHPSRALVDAASDAELLVVGSRGRGGFQGLLLGSVSQQCVQHASCPVVVIRAT